MKRLFLLVALAAATLSLSAQRKMQVWEGSSYSEFATTVVDSVTFLASPTGTLKPTGIVHDTIIKEVRDTVYIDTCHDDDVPVFSVSATKQVAFSKGNLQCTLSATDTTWSFAENQYDMLGTANVSGSALADKIDLFGWSGSTGSAKWGISTSTDYNDYSGDFVDWGQNTIGTNTQNTYRTLTNDEWDYLLNTRTDAANKKGVARIKLNDDGTDYVNGLILLPDSWTCPENITFKSDFASAYGEQAYADYQTFTLADWQKLEAAGAVFLPASGRRYGSDVSRVQYYGYYWSATPDDTFYAYYLYFISLGAYTDFNYRYYGHAVRLVQDIKYTLTLTQPEHGTIAADKTEAVAGETVTLTITPAAYYTLKTITVLQGETPITTTAVEDTTNQYTFTMPAGKVTITAVFEKVASAFTPAAFSVANGKQILFSQGNLRCALSTTDTTWSFAEYQTEIIGTDNVSGGALADKIDLFGWSGSTGAAKWGIGTSTDYTDYSGDFVDWGQNIGDGTTYRTLTNNEWGYLLNRRTNADDKKAVARIKLNEDGTQYINGLILLPDSWTCPEGITFKSGFASSYSIQAYADYQTFTLAQWQQLEAAGAVFLPASGYRDGSNVYEVQSSGYCWSATPNDSYDAYGLYFYSNGAGTSHGLRHYYRQAVRLVQDVYAVNIAATTNGTVAADKTEAVAGDEVTLTITPDTGYELDVLTVQDAAGNPVTVNDNTFTMPASNVTVSATFKQSPQTAIGNTTDAADTTVRKILIDGQVYILRGDKTHTTTGIEVRP